MSSSLWALHAVTSGFDIADSCRYVAGAGALHIVFPVGTTVIVEWHVKQLAMPL